MNKKLFYILIIGLIIFCFLVGYNYLIAQKKIRETRPSPLAITLVSYPERVVSGQTGTFIWEVDSSPNMSTPQTTIYWGEIASPSALTQSNSPQAVGYPHHQDDYFQGLYKLPDTFDLSIRFDKPGMIYFRAYAKVGDNHLWTDEEMVEVVPNKNYVDKK